MGIFDFLRKNKRQVEETSVVLAEDVDGSENQRIDVIENTQCNNEQTERTFCEKVNGLLVNAMPELSSNDGWLDQTHIDGTQMKVKGVALSPLVLGMFDIVVVAKLLNGTIYYDFLSKKYAPNPKLRSFIQTCTSLFGMDKNGKGWCSQADVEPLKTGHFSRNWENVNILQTKREDWFSLVIAMRITITPELI